MQANFLLGELRITEPARMKLKRLPYDLICRHAINEHGAITSRERKQNERSMLTLGPIVSRYRADPTDPSSRHVTITTHATWHETIVELE